LAMAAADVVLVASGTATLEALLFEKPMVVAYRINWPSFLIGKCMVKITLVAMANLLAEREIRPEFLQNHCTPKNLSQAAIEYFENQGKVKTLIQEYKEIRRIIQKNANERATNALVSLLEK